MKGVTSVSAEVEVEVEESFSPRLTDFHSSHTDPDRLHFCLLFGLRRQEVMLLPGPPDTQMTT